MSEDEVKSIVKPEETEVEEEASLEEEEAPLEEAPLEEEGETRIYTIPLKKAYYVPRYKRTEKAIRLIREFILRHMKAERVVILQRLNEKVWSRGDQKPPRRIKVKAVKDKEGVVKVDIASD
ncbi:MAG: 50S ribosomal protein L31e [Candidatus Jordarchaeales archaeon]